MPITLADPTFRQLRNFIYERCGIYVSDSKKYFIENRLARRLQVNGLTRFEDYLQMIQYNSNGRELDHLYDAITTNETFFFREPHQTDLFIDVIVPRILEQKGRKEIAVWSAACSTGEEPYTIAMLVKEKLAGIRADITASDISQGVIASAKRGIYNSYSVRNVPEAYLKKYFTSNGQNFELSPVIKNMVSFQQANLTDEKRIRAMGGKDVIFCRNVLIYFDDKAKQKVVSLLYDSLKPKGYLFTGASESLHSITRAFRPAAINKVIVYQKG